MIFQFCDKKKNQIACYVQADRYINEANLWIIFNTAEMRVDLNSTKVSALQERAYIDLW